MSSLVISGDTSGTITLAAPAVAGANTITLPASTGTIIVSSTGLVSGTLINIRYFTAVGTATYTPTTGTNSVVVEVVGGGGGGGACNTTAGVIGGSGGGGGYARKRITSAFSGVTITVGAGGTAGSAGGAGGAGGTSSFGALLSATGGNGGAAGNTTAIKITTGGTGSLGDVNITGGTGLATSGSGAIGGASPQYGLSQVGLSNVVGTAGLAYGGGATGVLNTGAVAYAGAAGGQGIVIVYEYA